MSFHLAIGFVWALIFFAPRELPMRAALLRATLAGLVAFGLSYGAASLFPDPVDCTEQTPTGYGSC